jgi:hypothetical protein
MPGMSGQTFSLAAGTWAVCRLEKDAAVPAWAESHGAFSSVTRTPEELSIVCEESRVPAARDGFECEGGFALLKLTGPYPLDAVGVLASVAAPLAEAGISVLAIGTFDTDYLLVRRAHAERAVAALAAAGHTRVGG